MVKNGLRCGWHSLNVFRLLFFQNCAQVGQRWAVGFPAPMDDWLVTLCDVRAGLVASSKQSEII